MNKVILCGNLGDNPELKATKSGKHVCEVSLATSEGKDRSEWHRVVFFEDKAENFVKFTKKGSKVLVEGRNKTDKWQDKNGADHYTTKVYCYTFELLDKRDDSAPKQQTPKQQTPNEQDDFNDDIPF